MITAEVVYDTLLSHAPAVLRTQAVGDVTWRAGERSFDVRWVIRPNRIWRFGRLLLRCATCDKLASRLYLPVPDASAPACRACWGLTYDSRQANYKDSGPLRQMGITPRRIAKNGDVAKARVVAGDRANTSGASMASIRIAH